MIGQTLGNRYRVDELIGKGGMAIVYRATDLRTHKMVALKVLREEYLQNEEFLQRFDREAMVCAKTSHTNIVNLLDLGEEPDHTRYLVMEYVKGKTLKAMIREEGRIEPQRAVAITQQVLAALAHAHQRHIIHRDIKPQNVLVTENGHVKVADFGIARMTDSNTMTIADGNVMGSVHYFSPEQAQAKPVTQSSDLYSVGIMLYEMLSGQVPFDGDTPVSIAMKHLTELPRPISSVPGVTPALEQILQKALCKQANQRYQRAEEMAQDLRRAQKQPEGGFVNMRPPLKGRDRLNETEQAQAAEKKAKGTSYVLATAMVSILVIGVLAYACVAIYAGVFSRVNMPDFMGLDEATAKKMADGAGLSTVILRRADPSVQGVVIAQRPDSGEKLKRGEAAYITVSTGTDTLIVPNLTGLTPEEAAISLAVAGLSIGDEVYDISETLAGKIFKQEPAANVAVKPGEIVDVYVSRGLVIMSELTDRRMEEALLEIEKLGLIPGEIAYQEVDNIQKDNVVLAQDPESFEHTYPGSDVMLTIGRYDKRKYSAPITLSVTLPEEGGNVRIALLNPTDGKETDQFNWTYGKGGRVEISVTLRSEFSGKMRYRLYVDNAFVSEADVTLQAATAAPEDGV